MTLFNALQDAFLSVFYILSSVSIGLLLWSLFEMDRFSKRHPLLRDSEGVAAFLRLARSDIDRGRILFGVIFAILVVVAGQALWEFHSTGVPIANLLPLVITGFVFLAVVLIPFQIAAKLRILTTPFEFDENLHEQFDQIVEEWWSKSFPRGYHRSLLSLAAIANSSYPPLAKFLLFCLRFVDLLLTIFLISVVGMTLISNYNALFTAFALVLLIVKLIVVFILEKTAPPTRPFREEFYDTRTWAAKALPPLLPLFPSTHSVPLPPSSEREWTRFTLGVGLIFLTNYFFPWSALRAGIYSQFTGNYNLLIFLFLRALPLLAAIPLTVYGLTLKKMSSPPFYGWVALFAVGFVAFDVLSAIALVVMIALAFVRT